MKERSHSAFLSSSNIDSKSSVFLKIKSYFTSKRESSSLEKFQFVDPNNVKHIKHPYLPEKQISSGRIVSNFGKSLQPLENKEYFHKISHSYKKGKHQYFLSTTLILYIQITYLILSCFFSLTSILIYAAMTTLNNDSPVKRDLLFISFIFSHVLLMESVLLKVLNRSSFYHLRSSYLPLVDLMSLVASYLSIFNVLLYFQLSFLRIIRLNKIVKIIKLRWIINAQNDFHKIKREFVRNTRIPFSRVRKQLLKLILYLFSINTITAGIVQQISHFRPNAFSKGPLNYFDSSYFMIITFSTVGYGDITPTYVASRMMMCFYVMVFVYFISFQLSKIVKYLKMEKFNYTPFNFENHIIVFGDVSNDNLSQLHLINFLHELYQDYFYNPYTDEDYVPNCIVMTIEEEGDQREHQHQYKLLEKFPLFDIKIFHLPVKKYDQDAFSVANYQKARTVFCMNNNIYSDYKLSDKTITSYIKNLENIHEFFILTNSIDNETKESNSTNKYPSKKIYIQYLFSELNLDPFYYINKNIVVDFHNPRIKIKYDIIVKNIFAKGWSTFITNLLDENNYDQEKEMLTDNYYLNIYLQRLNQSLKIYKLPSIFHGRKFTKSMKIIYEYSILFKNKYTIGKCCSMSEILLIGIMSLTELPANIFHEHECQCENDQRENPELETDESLIFHVASLIENISYNPMHHKIKEDDYGIFITTTNADFGEFFDFLEKKLKTDQPTEMSTYSLNNSARVNRRKKKKSKKDHIDTIIKNLYIIDEPNIKPRSMLCGPMSYTKIKEIENSELNMSDGNIHVKSTHGDTAESLLVKQFSKHQRSQEHFLIKDYSYLYFSNQMNRVTHYSFLNEYRPKNHILILGSNFYLEDILYKIRIHSISNSIVIISEDLTPDVEQNIVTKFKNVFLVKRNYLDLNVLYDVQAFNAKHAIIISSQNRKTLNEDFNAIFAARILDQYFHIPYLVELTDENNLRFLGAIPVVMPREGENKSHYNMNDHQFNPHFLEGKVFLNQISDKILAKAYKNVHYITCLKALIQLDFRKDLANHHMQENDNLCPGEDNYEVQAYTNTKIHIFSVSLNERFEDLKYADLVKEFLDLHTIPLGIYNKRYKKIIDGEIIDLRQMNTFDLEKKQISTYSLGFYTKLLQKKFHTNILEFLQFNDLKSPLFITNPPHDLLLNSDMEILVLGNFQKFSGVSQWKKQSNDRPSEVEEKFKQKSELITAIKHVKSVVHELESRSIKQYAKNIT